MNHSKTERIDVRASTPAKQLLQESARACHKNLSEFLLGAGVTAAAQTLADRRQFVLDETQRDALVNQKANTAQTYVCCKGDVGVGFYRQAVGSVDPETAPSRVMKGLARHPVPVMILARLTLANVRSWPNRLQGDDGRFAGFWNPERKGQIQPPVVAACGNGKFSTIPITLENLA